MSCRVVTNFTEFSDDILLHILSFLSAWDLLNVLETCERLNKVGKDHFLWKDADFSEGHLTAARMHRRVIPCLQKCTKYLHLRGQKKCAHHKWKMDLLTPAVMTKIGENCSDLKKFCLTEAVFDAKKVKMLNFGEFKKLETLSIVGCEFINLPIPSRDGSYFRYIQIILPNLQTLEVSQCSWITDYDLMVLSKLDNLKRLILKSDLRIGYTIAYLSMSFRFGFKNLEELDLRGTSLQETDVPSVVQSGKLRCLRIGPIGKIKRLSNEHDDGLSLVMSDPHCRDESKHQVVVINMGPNGPHWRQASDEDLDKMGLQWVKNGLNRQVRSPEKEEEHYFFGREGKIVRHSPTHSGECSNEGTSRKRKHSESDTEEEHITKKIRPRLEYESSDDEHVDMEDNGNHGNDGHISDNVSSPETEERNLPDKCLSDYMVNAFRDHARLLKSLSLAGCAITNEGLLKLASYIPALKYLDVSGTLITAEGLQQAKALLPGCEFVADCQVSYQDR